MVTTAEQKVASIDRVLWELAQTDSEFWTLGQLDYTVNVIADIINPDDEGNGDVFYHKEGSITDDGQNEVEAGWYFWDEASLYHGPFDTYDIAVVNLQQYMEELG